MTKNCLRPMATVLVLAASLSAIYLATWKYDPARLRSRAAKGQVEAQYRLGKAYFDGHLLERNDHLAAIWLAKAAAQGHAKAQAGLALMYAQGFGVRQDSAEAVKWYRQAASQGLALAQNQMGVCYAKGKGVPRDLDEAIQWFSRAAEQGSKTARQNLALTQDTRSGHTRRIETKERVYPAATVVKVESEGLVVAYRPEPGGLGFAKIRSADLPADFQHRYGYDLTQRPANESGLTPLISLSVLSL